MTSHDFTELAQRKGIALNYIQPGEPNQNAYIERFNKTYGRSAEQILLSRYFRLESTRGPDVSDRLTTLANASRQCGSEGVADLSTCLVRWRRFVGSTRKIALGPAKRQSRLAKPRGR